MTLNRHGFLSTVVVTAIIGGGLERGVLFFPCQSQAWAEHIAVAGQAGSARKNVKSARKLASESREGSERFVNGNRNHIGHKQFPFRRCLGGGRCEVGGVRCEVCAGRSAGTCTCTWLQARRETFQGARWGERASRSQDGRTIIKRAHDDRAAKEGEEGLKVLLVHRDGDDNDDNDDDHAVAAAAAKQEADVRESARKAKITVTMTVAAAVAAAAVMLTL